ncbi:hypothetical protein DSO57_1028609 [Entomophthora muscae]|uniref:Uncharacterized protein n=1 Tax=Entomophthora muscae TaxID=34485 RepID=A0ACC2T1B1_9FUNG|nr:hypothetical protein DSO57_1028609 [Entomophthora muscae]
MEPKSIQTARSWLELNQSQVGILSGGGTRQPSRQAFKYHGFVPAPRWSQSWVGWSEKDIFSVDSSLPKSPRLRLVLCEVGYFLHGDSL